MTQQFSRLVDRIYESAIEPDLWSSVLTELGRTVDAPGGLVLIRRGDDSRWLGLRCSHGLIRGIETYPSSEAARTTRTTERLLAADRPGFITNQELFSEKEYGADPTLADWIRPNGLYNGAATAIRIPTGDLAVVQILQKLGQPAFDRHSLNRLDRFRPHLSRACMLAARLRFERFRSAVEALALIGLPAAVLDRNGTVLVANELIQTMTQHIVWKAKSRLAFADPAATALLEQALAEIESPTVAAGRSFPVKGRLLTEPVVAHLLPTTSSSRSRDFFEGGFGILVVTPLHSPVSLSASLVQGLFDLTPAESRVACAIVEGLTIDEIANRHRVSRETVRTQMKAVLAKIGVDRQVEAAATLAAVPRIGGPGSRAHE